MVAGRLRSSPPLTRRFFRRAPADLAQALLGQTLVHIVKGERLSGVIVETEAYLGLEDKAAHTYRGRRTARNEAMFLDGGHAYVYFTYGMHHCMNVVASVRDDPVAVLIRALEPVEGIETMREHRRLGDSAPLTALCSGPGKLCQALAITRERTCCDMVAHETFYIERTRRRPMPASLIHQTPRIGIGYAQEWTDKPLRYYLRGNPHVSRP